MDMEDMDMEDVFLFEKNIWIWKMSSCWIRRYGYGRCLLVGQEDMDMEDAFEFLFFFLCFMIPFIFGIY